MHRDIPTDIEPTLRISAALHLEFALLALKQPLDDLTEPLPHADPALARQTTLPQIGAMLLLGSELAAFAPLENKLCGHAAVPSL